MAENMERYEMKHVSGMYASLIERALFTLHRVHTQRAKSECYTLTDPERREHALRKIRVKSV